MLKVFMFVSDIHPGMRASVKFVHSHFTVSVMFTSNVFVLHMQKRILINSDPIKCQIMLKFDTLSNQI